MIGSVRSAISNFWVCAATGAAEKIAVATAAAARAAMPGRDLIRDVMLATSQVLIVVCGGASPEGSGYFAS